MSSFNNDISNTGGPGSAAEPSMEEILASIRRILKDDDRAPAVDLDDEVLVLDDSMVVRPVEISSATQLPPENDIAAAHPDAPVTTYHEAAHIASEPAPFEQGFPPPGPEPESEPVYSQYEGQHEPEPLPEPVFAAEAVSPEPVNLEPVNLEPVSQAEPHHAYEPPAPEPDYIPSHDAPTESHMSENVQPPHGLLSEETSSAAASSIGSLVRSISSDRSVAVSRGGVTIEDIVREEIRPLLKSWLDTHLPSLVERIVRSEIERVIDRSSV